MAKYFYAPFGVSGTRTTIPNPVQSDGSVSYTAGFPIDYQKKIGVDPNAKPIPRDKFNELMYETQLAIQQYQQFGCPDFITTADNLGTPFPYGVGAFVRYDDGDGFQVYQSLVDDNTALPTDTTNWVSITGGTSNDTFIGEGKDYYGLVGSLPAGSDFLECDGSAVSRTTYAALFAVLGTTYGVGDGSTTFNIPDARRRVSCGAGGSGSGTLGNTVGSTGGEETHTQTVEEMPAHDHATAPGYKDDGATTGGGRLAFLLGTPEARTGSAGSGTPFNVLQPTLVITKLIRHRVS